jgi:tRNA dimethylallyltransferase
MDAVRVWPTERLRGWVRRLDPARAHLGRAQLLRALEVALLSGVRLSALHAGAATAPRFRGRWLVVDPGDRLHAHIEHRLDAMLAAGWADEVRALADTVPSAAPAWQGCGYAALRAAVRTGDVSAARTDILVSTRQYAKRQRTWFRHQLGGQDVTRLDPHAPRAESLAEEWWAAEVGA